MSGVLKILRKFACFVWRMVPVRKRREIKRFGRGIKKDMKPAYKDFLRSVFFLPRKSSFSSPPIKSALSRPGADAHQQNQNRMFVRGFILASLIAIALAFAFVVVFYTSSEQSKFIVWLAWMIAICPVWLPPLLLLPILKYQSDDYYLGYRGERAVAEELDNLGRLQWHIFHDFQFSGGNIDHIIICPKGVFCLETKSLRINLDNPEPEKISFREGRVYDGKYPLKRNPASQAGKNAKKLRNYLNEECFDNKTVVGFAVPIVVFPGREVECVDAEKFILCNPEVIGDIFQKRPDGMLSGEQIAKIFAALEKHNRSAE